MGTEFNDISLTEIEFLEHIFSSDFGVTFLVRLRNQQCVMKVHRGVGPRQYYDHPTRELDIHVLEANAYARLKDRGLCDRGIVPQYLGSIRKFDPSTCQPHLHEFLKDEYPPSAIFLEYIPGIERISLETYNPQRVDNLVFGLREIHKAHVIHCDIYVRNMMVVKDSPDRVIWLDFDRAETFDEDKLTEEEAERLRVEEQIMEEFRDTMTAIMAEAPLDSDA
ncbi:hypothetical protein N7462_006636 [Penicillium macrosclerotiorum]|uniref:uncharacterized protein n=1 Tax=Penicillium macrosclerotiorum TaxID=303699 RepID=UPI0025496F4E|nr:uncharacterized protein N7462_006636 [Penicillium macrosclerotiorum]KAJ5683471.1 hypothetical protein N7462_006636 [Penicillium macrosclerotiorum]